MRSIPERRGSRFHGNVILCWGAGMSNRPVLRPVALYYVCLDGARWVSRVVCARRARSCRHPTALRGNYAPHTAHSFAVPRMSTANVIVICS